MGLPRIVASVLSIGLAAGQARAETGRPLTVEGFFSVCEARTIAEAGALGDALGWRAMTEADRAGWTRAIEADQGVAAASVGWRRGEAEGADALAFWTVVGNGQRYRACAFTTRHPSELSAAFRRRFGPPASDYHAQDLDASSWTAGRSAVTESRAGTATLFEIVTDE